MEQAHPLLPGCRTVAQAAENIDTLARGPLPADAYAEVERLLADLRQIPAEPVR